MRKDPGNDAALQLVPASGRSRAWLWLLGALFPLALSVVVSSLVRPGEASLSRLFSDDWRTRAWAGFFLPDHLLGPLLVACIVLTACALLDWMLRRHRLQLDASGIEIATTFYRQRIAFPDLKLDAARVVRLDEHPDLKPLLKSNGYALPGFRSGWFRLRNWQKAFVATSDGERVLWLPTSRGFGLLLQPRDPQRLLDRVRELASPRPR